ncbi:TSC22 domain family protein 4-like [Watersipora subatra]|uniref:TSC22 domain family protein 4-like n=1 Tax=Watersipora subatra TaxID=2589382 RepID=UPI00355C29CB
MSDQEAVHNPNRVELVMTNHITQPSNTEHINGGVATKTGPALLIRQDSSEALDAKPKSTFKITSVTLHTQQGSSQDGRHSFGEDDEESAVEDSLVQTDADESPSNIGNMADTVKTGQRQDRVDSTSRFKVVKIQKREPYVIGRWRISDFMSEPEASGSKIVAESAQGKRSDSGNSSRASSTHYVHGVDDPSKNPLASVSVSSNPTLASIQQSPLTQSGLPTVITAEPSNVMTPETQGTINKADAVGESAAARANGDMVGTDSKDPHLIAPHSNHPTNSNDSAISAAVAAAASVTTTSASGAQALSHAQTTVEQTAATPQVNTQTLPHTSMNKASGQQVATAATTQSVATGSSSDSHSSAPDANQKPADDAPAAASLVTKLQLPLVDNPDISGGVEALAANLTELVDPSAAADGDKAEDADATGTGVAIDNKIEQAMDLVKSHLMLAVREEVEDLKLQIKQLIERNSQLEQENKLLRSSAAPETMAQLALLNRQQNH